MATFINPGDTRFTRFLERRFQSSSDRALNPGVRTDVIAGRPEHERLRMGV